jgi:hypothetical protein
MNEYQMTHLAASRQQDLLAEAQRARLARLARSTEAGEARDRRPRQRRTLGLGLRTLLGRRPQTVR